MKKIHYTNAVKIDNWHVVNKRNQPPMTKMSSYFECFKQFFLIKLHVGHFQRTFLMRNNAI